MPKGSVGSATYLVYTRKKKRRPSDCKQCRHSSQIGNKTYCNVTGEQKAVNRKWCMNYIGPYIKPPKKSKKRGK